MKQESIALSCFGELLATKCVFPDNQIFIARPTLIYLNPDKLHYYSFMVSLDRCNKIFNNAEEPPCRMCDANKIQEVNLHVFNMETGANESKTSIKHISYKCRFKFDGTKCNLKQKWNEDNKCRCKCNRPRKTIVYAKTIMLGILAYIFLRLGKI